MFKAIKSQIKVRQDTSSNWTTNNPVLANGELGFDTDKQDFKVGDGSTAWSLLSYTNSKITLDTTPTADSANGVTSGGVYTALANKLDSENVLTFSAVSVATTDWSADTTYADYGYKATISVSGITASYSAQVNFSPTEVVSGIYASFTSTGSGAVYLWASEVPSSAISVDIIATKVVS